MQFQQYLRMIQKSWWIIIVTTLAALIVALIVAYNTIPLYRSSARLIISPNPEIGNTRDIANSLATLDRRSIAVTYAEVLNSNRLMQETAAALALEEEQLAAYVLNAVVLPEANILEVSATGPNPDIAAQIVNDVGEKGTAFIRQLYPAYDLSVLDAATPPLEPISPQPLRDAGLAGALGLLAGTALAVLRGYLSIPFNAFRERMAIDPASGAYNRRQVLRLIEEQTLVGNGQLSVMMARAEELRDLMDVLPETSTNRLLHKMVQVLRSELRGNDIVGRWTDTTFIVMLPATPEVAARRTADRVRAALKQPITLELQPEPIGLNLRVSAVTRQPAESIDALIKRVENLTEQLPENESDDSAVFSGTHNILA